MNQHRPIPPQPPPQPPKPCAPYGFPRCHNQFTEEETAEDYVYEMYKPELKADGLRVEIRRGRALRAIRRGDETVEAKLERSKKMKMREATASLRANGMLTIRIPKRLRPRKWHEYADLVFMRFKTVRVGVSTS